MNNWVFFFCRTVRKWMVETELLVAVGVAVAVGMELGRWWVTWKTLEKTTSVKLIHLFSPSQLVRVRVLWEGIVRLEVPPQAPHPRVTFRKSLIQGLMRCPLDSNPTSLKHSISWMGVWVEDQLSFQWKHLPKQRVPCLSIIPTTWRPTTLTSTAV